MIPRKKMTYPLPHVVQDNYKETDIIISTIQNATLSVVANYRYYLTTS